MKIKAQKRSTEALNNFQKRGSYSGTMKSPQRSGGKSAADLKCEKLKKDLNELKVDLGRECDDILNKIDSILDTQIVAFDKIGEIDESLE